MKNNTSKRGFLLVLFAGLTFIVSGLINVLSGDDIRVWNIVLLGLGVSLLIVSLIVNLRPRQ
jgi:hypothetical protein